jgi:hypothetical protein
MGPNRRAQEREQAAARGVSRGRGEACRIGAYALETRLMAELTDLVAKATILRIADEYDQLAVRAAD